MMGSSSGEQQWITGLLGQPVPVDVVGGPFGTPISGSTTGGTRLRAPSSVSSEWLPQVVAAGQLLLGTAPLSAISVVQSQIAPSPDAVNVSVSMPAPVTPGNLLVLGISGIYSLTAGSFKYPSGWTSELTYNATNLILSAMGWRVVAPSDGNIFDFPSLWIDHDADAAFSVCLWELSGADSSSPFDYTNFSNQAGLSGSLAVSSGYGDLALLMASFYSATTGTGPNAVGFTSAPAGVIADGVYFQPSAQNNMVLQNSFAHGPAATGASVTEDFTIAAGLGTSNGVIASAMTIRASTTPPPVVQTRLWTLDIHGGAADTPKIVRNDTGAVLLSGAGGYPSHREFGPAGLVMPAGTSLLATSAAAADFGVTYDYV